MKRLNIGFAIFFASVALLRADDTIAKAQQTLKDQGFYYGEITGQKNPDTTAAIRRYQIRNGLQVTGELDAATLRALEHESANPPPAPEPQRSPRPVAPEVTDEDPDVEPEPESKREPFSGRPNNRPAPPIDAYWNRPEDGPTYRAEPFSPPAIVPPAGGLFAGTPYETAPPELQRDVVASAQTILARRRLYQNEIDGIFGPNTEFSLRAYQSKIGLPVTGRLDLETLAALDLLPGRRLPIFAPRRSIVRPPVEEPIRGEWIRE